MSGAATMTVEQFRALHQRRQPERDLQRSVVDLAKLSGALVWHDHATNQRTSCRVRGCSGVYVCSHCRSPFRPVRNRSGFPDLVIARPPVLLIAELKSERGQRDDDQVAWGDALSACERVEYRVWRPSEWPRILEVLG